jgi:hypothetical protein
VAKKSSAKGRAAAPPRIGKKQTRPLAAMEEDPNDNSRIPPTGLAVGNNSDGTFTVSNANQIVTVGTPSAQARKFGHRGGIVVVGIVAGERLPVGTISVRDPDELEDKLKSEVSAASIARAAGHTNSKEVHFSLKGLHTLDFGKLSPITGGRSSFIVTHIHIDRDHG